MGLCSYAVLPNFVLRLKGQLWYPNCSTSHQLLWQGTDLQARVTSLFWPFKIHFLVPRCNLWFAHREARVCEAHS